MTSRAKYILTLAQPAIWGLPGYTMMGIHKEVLKIFGASAQTYIISARTAQGYDQWRTSSKEEQLDIISRWKRMESKSAKISVEASGGQDGQSRMPVRLPQTYHPLSKERKDSQGLQRDHIEIRRAQKANIEMLQAHNPDENDEALNRAIEASLSQAAETDIYETTEAEHAAALKAAIQRSLSEPERPSSTTHVTKEAEEAELKRAIEESLRHHNRQIFTAKEEEDIVMEYIKKQSLAEDEHKLSLHRSTSPGSNNDL